MVFARFATEVYTGVIGMPELINRKLIKRRTFPLKIFVTVAGAAAFIYCLVAPVPSQFSEDMGRSAMIALGVLLLAIALWVTDIIHNAFTGFTCCAILYACGRLLSLPVLQASSFAGFADSSVWFVFSGLIIGCAMVASGLSRRLFLRLMLMGNSTYKRTVLLILLFSCILTFFIPSTDGRTIMLLTLVLGMKFFDQAHEGEASPLKGIMIMIPVSCGILGIGVMASVSAITAQGLIERYMGVTISYAQWMLYFLPAVAVTIVVLYLMVNRLFKCSMDTWDVKQKAREESDKLGPLTAQEKRVIVLVGIAVLLWFTGPLTGLRTDIVAMFCACLLLIPPIGFLTKEDLKKHVNWLIAPIFLGTALSIVDALNDTGMLEFLGNAIFDVTLNSAVGAPAIVMIAVICLLAAVLHLFSSHSTMLIASFLPLILSWTTAHDLGLYIPLAFIWGSQIEFMVYQSGAIITAYSYGEFTNGELLKLTVPFGLFLLIIGPVLLFGWWSLIGLI
jgi:anion transporter